MLAWSEELDNGRQKTRNHGYDVIVGGGYLLGLLRSPQTCHTTQNQTIYAGRYQLVGCLPQAVYLKDSLRKSGRCGIAAD